MAKKKRENVTCPLDGWPAPWIDGTGIVRFAGVTGPCHKAHSKCVRQLKREQAGERNAAAEPRSRKVNRQRAKRPKQEPAECPWPWKVRYPSLEAAETALADRQRDHGGDWLTAVAYDDCPAGHAHIGNPSASDRTGDSPADSEAA